MRCLSAVHVTTGGKVQGENETLISHLTRVVPPTPFLPYRSVNFGGEKLSGGGGVVVLMVAARGIIDFEW